MTGARHGTDEHGKSDTPNSYGPNPIALIDEHKANVVSRQDEARETISSEPKPGKALDFN